LLLKDIDSFLSNYLILSSREKEVAQSLRRKGENLKRRQWEEGTRGGGDGGSGQFVPLCEDCLSG